jgi:recombination protein RecT
MSDVKAPAAPGTTTAVAKAEPRAITDQVLARVSAMQQAKDIQLPPDYSAANALKSAHLMLLETLDKNGKNVLESCSKESIANGLMSMVIQGLNPDKKQCYFIAYGGKLQMQRSYMGSVSVARRVAGLKDVNAQVVYEGEEFQPAIDLETGKMRIIKHNPDLTKIDGGKIVGAYAIAILENGERRAEYMTFGQIQRSWQQNKANNGNSPAHIKFPEEMAKKTVINRALKLLINTSTDSSLFDDGEPEEVVRVEDTTYTEVRKEIDTKANSGQVVSFDEPTQPAQVESGITKKQADPEPEMVEEGPDF